MELFKTVPAYSWLFIYFRKYWNLRNIVKLIEKLSRRHLINSSDVFVIKGFTVVKLITNDICKTWCRSETKGLLLNLVKLITNDICKTWCRSETKVKTVKIKTNHSIKIKKICQQTCFLCMKNWVHNLQAQFAWEVATTEMFIEL